VRRLVASDSNLLILGETGVGKEWLARAVHNEGPRSGGPFLAVNCAALPDALLESELFGHERGAFTGAVRAHRGAFELAHRGTLFLDEVGELPLPLQAKFLRVIEERRITRLGGERAFGVDVRVMAATNRDLEAEVRARRFRADLYYRLGVVALTLPPLRDRVEDVPGLAASALRAAEARVGRPGLSIEPEAMAALVAYAWPGNVRELRNVIERAALLAPGDRLSLADFPRAISALAPGGAPARAIAPTPPAPGDTSSGPISSGCSRARAGASGRARGSPASRRAR
jgi:transcriptional regulator with GAF, ATPase, and Fis domain